MKNTHDVVPASHHLAAEVLTVKEGGGHLIPFHFQKQIPPRKEWTKKNMMITIKKRREKGAKNEKTKVIWANVCTVQILHIVFLPKWFRFSHCQWWFRQFKHVLALEFSNYSVIWDVLALNLNCKCVKWLAFKVKFSQHFSISMATAAEMFFYWLLSSIFQFVFSISLEFQVNSWKSPLFVNLWLEFFKQSWQYHWKFGKQLPIPIKTVENVQRLLMCPQCWNSSSKFHSKIQSIVENVLCLLVCLWYFD